MTIQEMQDRWYFWHRYALRAGLANGGINRNSERTKQLWRIEQLASRLLQRAKANKDIDMINTYYN